KRLSRHADDPAEKKASQTIPAGLAAPDDLIPELCQEFSHLPFSAYALQKLLADYSFESVLDIGCGAGVHAEIFLEHGKKITAIDYGNSPYFQQKRPGIRAIVGDFNTHPFDCQFDCIWCSHVLEHQLNPNLFLCKLFALLREGGVLAVTVPPCKHEIVGGHMSLWNAGLVLYHLILAGFNCRQASILQYGYNISVIVRKESIQLPSTLAFDQGDIRKLKAFLPEGLQYNKNENDDPFDGNITRLNWQQQSAGVKPRDAKSLPAISAAEVLPHTSRKLFFINWSGSEFTHRWSSGKSPEIIFAVDEKERPRFQGKITMRAGFYERQRIRIYLNNHKIFSGKYKSWDDRISVRFNPAWLKVGNNNIRFALPDARQPGNGDVRVVALALKSFSIV
ncbi:class I SAM-dependent methyltransferase, partial [candidate division FCPU426 bacterium]|nr:class I SAM-dependent methyltransferase [candidate division FCPU426 bacterium]